MEDASMVGTLRSQAVVVWPKEREILLRGRPRRVLDLACGTGEILRRVRAELRPELAVGVDLFRGHLRRAGRPVVQGDGRRTPFREGTFDLVLVRHVLQAVPDPVVILREARRVLRPGGRVHLLVEDYSSLLFDIGDHAAELLFAEVTPAFRRRGTDLHQGRRAYRHLREAGFEGITVEPLLVDTLTADRGAFADVLRHWRDGYAATLAGLIGATEAEVRRRFDLMIDAIRDEGRYSAWLLLVVSAEKRA
jgi:ubiquinone/menaquinone biosynthesis C-methylase UbiE